MTPGSIPLVLLSLLAACGDVTGPGGHGADGGAGDGGGDSDASVPGTVTVTVLDPDGTRAPLEGVPVVFFEADGGEVDTVMTDDEGMAAAELHPGGAVIAFVISALPAGVATPLTWAVVDVQPGDEITLGGRRTTGEVTDSMTIELPEMVGATYEVETPCGSWGEGDAVVQISNRDSCELTSFSIVAYARVGEDMFVVSDTGLEFDEGSNHVVSGEWEAVPTPDVTVEGLDDVGGLYARWTRGILDGDNLPLGLDTADGEVDGEVLTLTPRRLSAPEHVMLELNMAAEQAGLGGEALLLWSDGDEGDVVIDASDLLLPWVGAPAIDQSSRQVSWSHAGDGEWDATYLSFSWVENDGKVASAGQWRVVAPPGHHDFVLPPLPEAYREWLPDDIDTITEAYVVLFDSEALDWDGARQLGLDPIVSFDYSGTLTSPATVRYSSSFFD